MPNYANQIKIDIPNIDYLFYHEGDILDENGYLPLLKNTAIYQAAQQLNGNAFKIWIYILRWKNQGYFYFSPAAITNAMGIPKQSVSDAKKELIRKGFIQQDLDNPNKYIFVPKGTYI